MKLFAMLYVICTSYNIVCAMLPRPQINRDNAMVITVLDSEVPDDEIISAFRRKLYDVIETVKWNAKLKLWADLGIQVLRYPILKVNEMVNSVGHQPNYDTWFNKLRQIAIEKGQKTFTAGMSKLTNMLNDLHANLKIYIDTFVKEKLTSHEDLIYMDYNDYIQ